MFFREDSYRGWIKDSNLLPVGEENERGVVSAERHPQPWQLEAPRQRKPRWNTPNDFLGEHLHDEPRTAEIRKKKKANYNSSVQKKKQTEE